MRYLLVAEKNSLMRTIEDVYKKHKREIADRIGGEIDFIALSGHIVKWYEPKEYMEWKDLKWADMNLPLIPEPFQIRPSDGDYQKQKFKEWKEAIKSGKYTGYICACDPDAEGDLIFWRAAKYLHIDDKPTLRFFQNSLTETEVLDALMHMEDFYSCERDKRMLEQALSRSKFDWIVGMNCTIAMSVRTGSTSHIGRVQAPTIKLVYDNSEKIDKFEKKTTYLVQTDYEEGFSGLMVDDDKKEIEYERQEDALKVIGDISDYLEAEIVSIEKKVETKSPEKLYRLSSLQVEAGKKGISPIETLAICQVLYEKHKVLSYPRSDCQCVSTAKANQFPTLLNIISEIPELKQYVDKITPEDIETLKKNKNVVNDEKVKKESHDALLPTAVKPNFSEISEKEKLIYTMVAKRFLSQFMPILKEEKTVIIAKIGDRLFKSTGARVLDPGWTVLYDKKTSAQSIPGGLKEGSCLFVDEYKIHNKETKPIDRLTEATLVSAMENIGKLIETDELKGSLRSGIGTQATRATIIEEIIKDGYVKSEGKNHKLYITEKGKAYIRRLEWSSIISPENAARWETVFTDVRDGNKSYAQSLRECEFYVREFIKDVNIREFAPSELGETWLLDGVKCPYCNGKIKSIKFSYICENAKENGCNFMVNKCEGRVKDSDVKTLIEKGKTRKIAKFATQNLKISTMMQHLGLTRRAPREQWHWTLKTETLRHQLSLRVSFAHTVNAQSKQRNIHMYAKDMRMRPARSA